jgi:hypothetical protein
MINYLDLEWSEARRGIKAVLREQLEADVKKYLDNGGEIKTVAQGETGVTDQVAARLRYEL